ncbi:MAG: sigma-70 family RNA polymerase sigma factor [bacterium]
MDIKTKNDEVLMELYKEGQEAAFNELYLRYKSKVYGYLKCKLGGSPMLDEVYQNIFLKLHKTRDLYNPKYKFPVWLFTIVKTSLIDAYRSNGHYKTEELPDNLTETLENKDDVCDIEAKLSGLSPSDSNVIKLRYYDDKSFEEIAKELETTSMNARQRVSRAIHSLRKIFKGGHHE